MYKKWCVGLVFFMSVFLFGSICFASFNSAVPINTNTSVQGNLPTWQTKNYYTFTLAEDGFIRIDFEHDNFTDNVTGWNISLYDINTKQMYRFSSKWNQIKASSPNTGLPQGKYYVLVEASSSTFHRSDDYTLRVNYTKSDHWEKELNDTILTATKIAVNQPYKGSIHTWQDKDYFEFTLAKDGFIRIDFEHDNFTDNNTGWNISLYDINSKQMYRFSSKWNQIKASSPNIGLPQGKYYVLVEASSSTFHRSDDYTLTVHFPISEGSIRLSGDDRFGTATAISQDSFPQDKSADVVVIVRGDDFADALPGGVLAYQKGGPLLLSGTHNLPEAVADEITRVLKDKGTIYILGGSAAISQKVEDQLSGLGDYSIVRIAGKDRLETSYKIAQTVGPASGKAIVAYALNFPDALAVSPHAAREGIPILLSGTAGLSSYAEKYMAENNVGYVYVIGGAGAISKNAFQQIEAIVGQGNVKRIGGTDRYETATKIADEFFQNPGSAAIAYGRNFPDALAGGPNAAKYKAPILMVETDSIPTSIEKYLESKKASLEVIIVYGGPAVVSDAVKNKAESLIE